MTRYQVVATTSGPASFVMASNGDMYYCDLNPVGLGLRMLKSTDQGQTWGSAASDQSLTTIFGGTPGTAGHYPDIAIDGNDIIHAVDMYAGTGSVTRVVAYATFNTSNDTWGSWETVLASLTNPVVSAQYGTAIDIDASNYPHVLFFDYPKTMGTAYSQIYYSNRTSGSWSSPALVSVAAKNALSLTGFSLKASDNAEAIWYDSTDSIVKYNTRTSGSWGTPSSIASSTALAASKALTITTGGTVYRYHGRATNYYENTTSTGAAHGVAYFAGAHLDGADRSIVATRQTGSNYWRLYRNSGSGWSLIATSSTGNVTGSLRTCWQYNHNNVPSGYVPFIFVDNSSVMNFESYPDLPGGERRIFVSV